MMKISPMGILYAKQASVEACKTFLNLRETTRFVLHE